MSFIPINYDSGKLIEKKLAGSVTESKGVALKDNGSGFLTPVAAGDGATPEYVLMESVSSTTEGDLAVCIPTRGGVRFEADTDAAPADTDANTYADLASKSTIDPDASVDDVFFIEKIKGAAADKKVIGYFQHGVPNS